MPKITEEEDSGESGDDEEFDELETDDEDVEQPIKAPKPKGQVPPGLRAWQERKRQQNQQAQSQAQQPQMRSNPQQYPSRQENVQPQAPKRRYGVIAAQPVRIVDAEGQEVIGEGEYLVAQALTDIIERLERIENAIGSMLGGN